MLNLHSIDKIGLIAGSGNLPVQIAQYIAQHSRDLTVVVLQQEDLEHYRAFTSAVECFSIGRVGAIFSFLHSHNATTLVFAGAVHRPDFKNINNILKVDLVGARLLAKIVANRNKGDDALLGILYNTCQSNGFKILSPLELIPQPDLENQQFINKQHISNIEIGIKTLIALGKCDVGQAVVVDEQRVIGIEAAEGTNALIERCANLRRAQKGGVMVKMMKADQNPIMDPPVIGIDTVQVLRRYKYDGLAVQKNKVIILDAHEILNQISDEFFLYVF